MEALVGASASVTVAFATAVAGLAPRPTAADNPDDTFAVPDAANGERSAARAEPRSAPSVRRAAAVRAVAGARFSSNDRNDVLMSSANASEPAAR